MRSVKASNIVDGPITKKLLTQLEAIWLHCATELLYMQVWCTIMLWACGMQAVYVYICLITGDQVLIYICTSNISLII